MNNLSVNRAPKIYLWFLVLLIPVLFWAPIFLDCLRTSAQWKTPNADLEWIIPLSLGFITFCAFVILFVYGICFDVISHTFFRGLKIREKIPHKRNLKVAISIASIFAPLSSFLFMYSRIYLGSPSSDSEEAIFRFFDWALYLLGFVLLLGYSFLAVPASINQSDNKINKTEIYYRIIKLFTA
jgi:hypothetical protein